MTCIVAITDGENIVMGGDAAASSPDGPEIYTLRNDKVFAIGEYLVGYCASYRAGQLARWQLDWPAPPPVGSDIERFLVVEIVPRLRRSLAEGGVDKPAQFLIGLRGQLFAIGSDWTAATLEERYTAIGSGRHAAYGALFALADLDLPAEEKVLRALKAAQRYTSSVREPFRLLTSAAGRTAALATE